MSVNCPCEITASAPCSMVSLILSCFSSLREICSDTQTLLMGLEYVIVTQEPDYRRALKGDHGRGADFYLSLAKCRGGSRVSRIVVDLKGAERLASLLCAAFGGRRA